MIERRDPEYAPRCAMVAEQVQARGIVQTEILSALRSVPRHRFVPVADRSVAYADRAVPLGPGQSISQPYIVGLMTESVLGPRRERVLEIGTGSGYQAAVLAELYREVYTVELDPGLAVEASAVWRALQYRSIHGRVGDGHLGWPEKAPFDAILITAATANLPRQLTEQLAPEGRLIYPRGTQSADQALRLVQRNAAGQLSYTTLNRVRFVPLVRP